MDRFFSFEARITRVRLILAIASSLLLALLMTLPLRAGGAVIMVVVFALGGAVSAKLLAETVRRRHDMGSSGLIAVALFAGSIVVMAVALVYALGTGNFIVCYCALAMVALGWAALLLQPSEPGANRYGPPVAHALRPAFGERRRSVGAMVAIVLTLAGGATGYAGARWLEAMRNHQALVQQQAAALEGSNDAPNELEKLYQKQDQP